MTLDDYPKELTANRQAIECNFVFTLYKNPDLVDDYTRTVTNGTDILTPDGVFYYGLAINLRKAGYQVFDNISIYTYLESNETLKNGFDKRGGFSSVSEITSLLNEDNIDSYYDDLVKNNMLLRLYDAGFDVKHDLDKFNEMSAEDVYDFYDYKLNNICISKIEKVQAEDISKGYDEYIKEWDSGVQTGYKIGFPMLNYRLAGVHKENFLIHLAGIGQGKTSSAILFYVLPVIESGNNVTIIGTEQSVGEWRSILLASVLFNKIGYFGMNRQKITIGHFNDEQRAKLHEAAEWLEKQQGHVTFVEMQNYDFTNIRKVIRKYSKLNCGLFLIDTLKPLQENSQTAWADFSEVAKELFLIAKKERIACIATAQISAEAMSRKFLDLTCIAKSRAIAETATQVVMFRPLSKDEREKLKPWVYKKAENGKYSKVRQEIELDPDKDYIVLFTPKNRFGDIQPQIIYERNMAFNTMKEIGYIEITYDGYR